MLSSGLYRVRSCEQLSLMLHMGLEGIFARTGAQTGTFTLTEQDPALRGNSDIVVPEGTKIHLGGQGFRSGVQVVSMNAAKTFSSGVLTVAVDETISELYTSATVSTLMYVPSASEDSTDSSILLNKRTFGILESPSSDYTVYDLCFGISMHPKYIGANGDITDSGLTLGDGTMALTGLSIDGDKSQMAHLGSAGSHSDGTRALVGGTSFNLENETAGMGGVKHGTSGYGMSLVRYGGMISPKIRVEQPQGVVRFATDLSKGRDADARITNKTGFLSSGDTSVQDMNQRYRIVTNSSKGDGSLPSFQLLQDKLEPMRDPHILLLGMKLVLDEVSEGEVKEMIRRSGRFNYKIIEDPTESYKTQSDSVSGPVNGWKELVDNQRGKRLSFKEYQEATNAITTQTTNQLYGTGSPVPSQTRNDPRRAHRRG